MTERQDLKQRVWVVTGVEDDDTDSGYRYVVCVVDSAEKAASYDHRWYDVEEFDVQ